MTTSLDLRLYCRNAKHLWTKEEKLFDELEAMDQRVVESEKIEADSDQMEALQSHYKSLQVSPDDSLETIKKAYERLAEFWGAGRFADNPSFREWSERKLTKITHAYGKILDFRQMEKGLPSAVPPIQISKGPDLFAPDKEAGHHFIWSKIFLGGAAFVVVVLAVFFWPSLYHYDTIPSGDKTYQIRTNRITGSMNYFDQGRWNNPPMPPAKFSVASPVPVPAPPAPPPELSAKQPIPTPETEPGPAEGPKVAGKKEGPSEKQAGQPAKAKNYVIQVKATRDLNLAKEFVKTQSRSGQQVYLVKIKFKGRGVWYIAYIGRFADQAQAARYMKKKKVKEIFPECSIKKLS